MVMLKRLQVRQTFKLILLMLELLQDIKVITGTVTGVSTSVTTGGSEAWNPGIGYSGPGLTTTTSDKVTSTGVGTVRTFGASQVIKVVTEINDGFWKAHQLSILLLFLTLHLQRVMYQHLLVLLPLSWWYR